MSHPLVVAITGASGAPFAVRLLQVLAHADRDVHLTISPSGAAVIRQELGLQIDLEQFSVEQLLGVQFPWNADATERPGLATGGPSAKGADGGALAAEARLPAGRSAQFHYHHYTDYLTPIASGSFLTAGMIVCPCSGSTLSGIARAAASNLIQRAAEVHLKERRKLVVVPRETPLSTIQLENMYRLSQAGAVVLPAMPGWYHGVHGVNSLVDFVVARILDQFDLGDGLMQRWGDGG